MLFFSSRMIIALSFMILAIIHCKLIFYMVLGKDWGSFFSIWYPAVPLSIVKKTNFFYRITLATFENQLSINVWVYIWTLYLILLRICTFETRTQVFFNSRKMWKILIYLLKYSYFVHSGSLELQPSPCILKLLNIFSIIILSYFVSLYFSMLNCFG